MILPSDSRPAHIKPGDRAPKGQWSVWVGPVPDHGPVRCQHGTVHGRACKCCTIDRPAASTITCPTPRVCA